MPPNRRRCRQRRAVHRPIHLDRGPQTHKCQRRERSRPRRQPKLVRQCQKRSLRSLGALSSSRTLPVRFIESSRVVSGHLVARALLSRTQWKAVLELKAEEGHPPPPSVTISEALALGRLAQSGQCKNPANWPSLNADKTSVSVEICAWVRVVPIWICPPAPMVIWIPAWADRMAVRTVAGASKTFPRRLSRAVISCWVRFRSELLEKVTFPGSPGVASRIACTWAVVRARPPTVSVPPSPAIRLAVTAGWFR